MNKDQRRQFLRNLKISLPLLASKCGTTRRMVGLVLDGLVRDGRIETHIAKAMGLPVEGVFEPAAQRAMPKVSDDRWARSHEDVD